VSVVWYIAQKDLRALVRDRMALFWVLGFPLVFAVFLAAVLEAGLGGTTAPLPVQLVSDSSAPPVQAVLEALAKSERLAAVRADAASAFERVRRGQAVAALVVRAGADPSRAPLSVALVVDPARELDGERIRAEVERAVAPTSAAPRVAVTLERLATGDAPRRASDYVFAPAVLWGLIGCAACFAISLVAERARGTLRRLAAAPIHKRQILLGKALACGLACLAVAALIALVMGLGFSVRFPSPPKLALALVCTALCFSGITMLLSVLGKTEQSVAGAGWGALIVLAMIGGGMVPLSLMPVWLADIGHVSPVRWGIVALEGALWRGFSYAELAQSCAVLVATGVVSFGAGAALLGRAFRY
jgi:linearmycin/streptolysin S transport system permease protein